MDGKGFSLEYPQISVHAVSKQPSKTFPHQHLYMLINDDLDSEYTHTRNTPNTALQLYLPA